MERDDRCANMITSSKGVKELAMKQKVMTGTSWRGPKKSGAGKSDAIRSLS